MLKFTTLLHIADGDPPAPDYEKQELGLNEISDEQITELRHRICYNQTIFDDLLIEGTEYAGLTVEVQDLVAHQGPTTVNTEVGVEHAAIKIIDSDGLGRFIMMLSVHYTHSLCIMCISL